MYSCATEWPASPCFNTDRGWRILYIVTVPEGTASGRQAGVTLDLRVGLLKLSQGLVLHGQAALHVSARGARMLVT
jgi:hypothetical protein